MSNNKQTSGGGEPSAEFTLDDVCNDAFQAYNAMFQTKQQHFAFLEILDNKQKNFNLSPTPADKQKLAEYLAQHDEQVKRFTKASIELKTNHPESHKQLFTYIGQMVENQPDSNTEH
jgi:hypothetical protein